MPPVAPRMRTRMVVVMAEAFVRWVRYKDVGSWKYGRGVGKNRNTYVILRPCSDSVVLPIQVYHMTTAPNFPSELIVRSQQTANTDGLSLHDPAGL